jgi:hypothetical protein
MSPIVARAASARTAGDWSEWFGSMITLETASMAQVVTILPGSTLSFFFDTIREV